MKKRKLFSCVKHKLSFRSKDFWGGCPNCNPPQEKYYRYDKENGWGDAAKIYPERGMRKS